MVDHVEQVTLARKPFAEVMEEAKTVWQQYLDVQDEEEREHRLSIIKETVRKIFGTENFKVSAATPGQQDLVELFVDEIRTML